jgi:hypothetical protein
VRLSAKRTNASRFVSLVAPASSPFTGDRRITSATAGILAEIHTFFKYRDYFKILVLERGLDTKGFIRSIESSTMRAWHALATWRRSTGASSTTGACRPAGTTGATRTTAQ